LRAGLGNLSTENRPTDRSFSPAPNQDRFLWTGFFSGSYFRYEAKIRKTRKNNLGQVFRQNRDKPVLLENLSQDLFLIFKSCSTLLSEKSLSSETCPDPEPRKKNLSVSLLSVGRLPMPWVNHTYMEFLLA